MGVASVRSSFAPPCMASMQNKCAGKLPGRGSASFTDEENMPYKTRLERRTSLRFALTFNATWLEAKHSHTGYEQDMKGEEGRQGLLRGQLIPN